MIINSYKLVVVNSILLVAVLIFFGIYKFIFPKKNIPPLIIVIIFSLLPLVSLLRTGPYESGDFSINVIKSMTFYQALSEGIVFPRWSEALNATFGYPLFNFIYPLPYYIISFFHLLGFSFIVSLKLLLATAYIASGVVMYLWIKEEINQKSGAVAAIFYLYAPYHLVDMHYRVSLGEIVSYVFFPLSLLLLRMFFKHQQIFAFFLGSITVALLLLCNPALSLFAIPFSFVYLLFDYVQLKKQPIKILLNSYLCIISGLLLSAFYWLPTIVESKFTHEAAYTTQVSFVELNQLLFSPWRYGLLFQGPTGQLSFVIGYIEIVIIGAAAYFLYTRKIKKKDKPYVFFFLFFLGLMIFLMLPQSAFIWNTISPLKNFQFTYRLLFFVAIFVAYIAAILTKYLPTTVMLIVCFLAIITTFLNWGNRRTISAFDDAYLHKQIPFSTAINEGFQPAAPIWTDVNHPWQKIPPKQHLEILHGSATIKQLKRTTNEHDYHVVVTKPSLFKENTLYFPNWTVFANSKPLPITYTKQKFPGIMLFSLTKGVYLVQVKFLPTLDRLVAEWISAITLICLLVMIIGKNVMKFAKVFDIV